MTPPTWPELIARLDKLERDMRVESARQTEKLSGEIAGLTRQVGALEGIVRGHASSAFPARRSRIDWGKIGNDLLSWSIKGIVVILCYAVIFALSNGWRPIP